jgi:hypothetical protein
MLPANPNYEQNKGGKEIQQEPSCFKNENGDCDKTWIFQ